MSVLEGQKIVVTRAAEDCAVWAARLEQLGAVPIVLPCIRAELVADPDTAAALREAVADADWLILTSRRGVDACVMLRAVETGPDTRVAVVGRGTANRARAAFGRVDLIGSGTARTLGETLAASDDLGAGTRCVIAVAANAGNVLTDILSAAGAECRRFDLYRTIPIEAREPKPACSTLGAQAVVFGSPTAVEGFLNQYVPDGDCEVFTIGPSTSAAARERGLAVTGEAREPTFEAIVESIEESMHA